MDRFCLHGWHLGIHLLRDYGDLAGFDAAISKRLSYNGNFPMIGAVRVYVVSYIDIQIYQLSVIRSLTGGQAMWEGEQI